MNEEGNYDAYISSFSHWSEAETLHNIFSFMLKYLVTNFRVPESAFKHETYLEAQIWTVDSGYPKIAKFVNVLFKHIRRRGCAPAWLRSASEAASKKGKRKASNMLKTDPSNVEGVLYALSSADTPIMDVLADADTDSESDPETKLSTRKTTPTGAHTRKPAAPVSQNNRDGDTVLEIGNLDAPQESFSVVVKPPTKKQKLSE